MSDCVRVRGIYATAITAVLADRATIVDPSAAIGDRFDVDFGTGPADVRIRDTVDRQGVGLVGTDEAVEHVQSSLRVADDAFVWTDATPESAIFDGTVTETLDSGAVVDVGDGQGFLPYGTVAAHVETDDAVRVQVRAGRPPWTDERPVLDGRIEVSMASLTLVRGASTESGGGVDRTDLLAPSVPSDWGIRWDERADDRPLDDLETMLAAAVARAEQIDAAVADADPPSDRARGRLTAGRAGAWVWFGRDARFALDEHRRTVVPTLAGHHRIKAIGQRAGAAADFAEAVCASAGDVPSFPQGAVLEQFGPTEGDRVAIHHGKPDGRLLVLGEGEVIDVEAGQVTVRRELSGSGTYDGLGTERRPGDVAITKVREGRPWYPTVYRSAEGTARGTYVNVCTPVEVFPDRIRYMDLHVDVVRRPDGTVARLDDDELEAAVEAGRVPPSLADRARSVATAVEEAL